MELIYLFCWEVHVQSSLINLVWALNDHKYNAKQLHLFIKSVHSPSPAPHGKRALIKTVNKPAPILNQSCRQWRDNSDSWEEGFSVNLWNRLSGQGSFTWEGNWRIQPVFKYLLFTEYLFFPVRIFNQLCYAFFFFGGGGGATWLIFHISPHLKKETNCRIVSWEIPSKMGWCLEEQSLRKRGITAWMWCCRANQPFIVAISSQRTDLEINHNSRRTPGPMG